MDASAQFNDHVPKIFLCGRKHSKLVNAYAQFNAQMGRMFLRSRKHSQLVNAYMHSDHVRKMSYTVGYKASQQMHICLT